MKLANPEDEKKEEEKKEEEAPKKKKEKKRKGKKPRKNRPGSKKWTKYGEKKGRICERCGPGVFMAQHKDRYHCGKCNYTVFIKKIKDQVE